MAILSSFPSTMWSITLSTSLVSLAPGDVTVSGNTVSAVTGAGTTWTLTLGTAVDTLAPTSIAISGNTVTATDNASIAQFIEQIRNILRIGVTREDLSDSTIRELAFLRKAELAVYEKTSQTEAQYDTASASDPALRDRFRIAVMYRTAALLVPALPDIVRESFQSELRQYVQMDWEQKINFFISQSDDAIEEDIPEGAVISSVGSVGTSYRRYTAF